jgi:hypothetical protein
MRQAGAMRSRRRGPTLAVAASVAVGLFLAVPAGTAGAKSASSGHHGDPKLAQAGHVKFWECSSKTTDMLVAVNTLTLHPGETLDITFTVRNDGTSSCNYTAPYAGAAPGPTVTTLTAGPCGSVGFEIESAHGHEVWPGSQLINCPALGFAQLAPNATVSGTGSWNQDKPNTSQRVPPGSYDLIVANKAFTFPLRVAS